MSEALRSIVHFGFDTRERNRNEALDIMENSASHRLLEKHGL